jgi:hypothetical protein
LIYSDLKDLLQGEITSFMLFSVQRSLCVAKRSVVQMLLALARRRSRTCLFFSVTSVVKAFGC